MKKKKTQKKKKKKTQTNPKKKKKKKKKETKKLRTKNKKGTVDKINFITLKMDFVFMDNIKLLN